MRSEASRSIAGPRHRERSTGPDHPNVAIDLNNLAELLQAINRLSEAEPLDRRALGHRRAATATNTPTSPLTSTTWRCCCKATNRLARGRAADAPGTGHRRASLRPGSPRRRQRPQQPGMLLQATNRLLGGRAALSPGLAIDESAPASITRRACREQPGLVAPGHRIGCRRPTVARHVPFRVLCRFQRSTGHEQSAPLRDACRNARQVLTELKLVRVRDRQADRGGEGGDTASSRR